LPTGACKVTCATATLATGFGGVILARQTPGRLPVNLAPLRHINFFQFWAGFGITNAGKWIEQTGAVWLVYELTQSPALLGLLGVSKALPAFVLGPIAGVVVDRVDQRKLLLLTQSLGLLASLALGLLVASGQVQLWQIYLQVAIQSGIMAFDAPVRQALFPRLVPRDELPAAVTLTFSAGKSAAFIGPAIGGVAIATLGVASPFLLNAVTFLGFMGAVLLMRNLGAAERPVRSSFGGELIAGIRHIRESPLLSGFFKLEIVYDIFQVNAVIITIIGRDVLGVGPEGLGGLLSAEALGAIFGIGFLLFVGQSQRQGRFNVLSTVFYAGTLVAFALSNSFALAFAALAVSGFFDSLISVTRSSVLQLAAPPGMRGRVMSNLGTISRGLGPLGQVQSGGLAAAFGGPVALLGSAAILVVNAALTVRTNPTLWRFSRTLPGLVDAEGVELEPN
jgi:MFS family permease